MLVWDLGKEGVVHTIQVLLLGVVLDPCEALIIAGFDNLGLVGDSRVTLQVKTVSPRLMGRVAGAKLMPIV